MPRPPELIVALDVQTRAEAERFVRLLRPAVRFFKVGPVLFTACGPDAVRIVHDHGGQVFLDLKFFDIPRTVEEAVEQAARLGVTMLTVHTLGGVEMMARAVRAAHKAPSPPRLIGVTLPTHMDEAEMQRVGIEGRPHEAVVRLARVAHRAGLHGVVCAAPEVAAVKEACGPAFLAVVPGIRSQPVRDDDQARTGDPSSAAGAGADYLVLGRPILQAQDPLGAVRGVLGALR
jgi:orotidine-5'-phosphate decarboxylase